MYDYLITWLSLKVDRRGVTALEYGLIAALIAAFVATAVGSVGTSVSTTFANVAKSV